MTNPVAGQLDELRHAARRLRTSPGFTAVAALALAIGIGGTATLFSLADALLLRDLPGVGAPDELVNVHRIRPDGSRERFSAPDYRDLVAGLEAGEDDPALSGLAGFSDRGLSLAIPSAGEGGAGEAGDAELVLGQVVTGDYFRVLRVEPALGRFFTAEEDGAPGSAARELVVYAATSTRDVLSALESDFERAHGVDVIFNFGSSSNLANQIIAAGKADVFLSADEREMDRIASAGLLVEDTRRSLLSNQLVVIEPVDARAPLPVPFEPSALAAPSVLRVSLGNVNTVPAGRYAKAWLQRVGVWEVVEPKILPGVDVRAALAAVESGACDVGIVYRTDVARSTKARVIHAVPLEEGPKISYPVAALTGRADSALAQDFIEALSSPASRAVFDRFGFLVLEQDVGH
jgi:molybdate transport system substrate-binding protein